MPYYVDVNYLTAQTILEKVEQFKNSEQFSINKKYFTAIEGDKNSYCLRGLNINKSMVAVLMKTITCKQICFLYNEVQVEGKIVYLFSLLPPEERDFDTLYAIACVYKNAILTRGGQSVQYEESHETRVVREYFDHILQSYNNHYVSQAFTFDFYNFRRLYNEKNKSNNNNESNINDETNEGNISDDISEFDKLLEEIYSYVGITTVVRGEKNDIDSSLEGLSVLSLLHNANQAGLEVLTKLPSLHVGKKYLVIDSDKNYNSSNFNMDPISEVIFEDKQGATSSCGDNALICAKKAKQLGYKVSILLLKNGKDLHAVCAIEIDATTSSKVLYEELLAVEIAADEAKSDFDYSDYFYNLYSWLLNKFDLDNSYSVFDILKEYFQVDVLESSMSNLYFYPGAPNDPDYSSYGMNNFNADDSNFKNLQSNNTIGNCSDML